MTEVALWVSPDCFHSSFTEILKH